MAPLERVELTGGDPNRRHILVLDGGGVRGLSSLLILGEVFRQVNKHIQLHTGSRDPVSLKPHDIFHLVIGTSTGGLIALMIGKLGMSINECIDEYMSLSRIVFREGRHLRGKISAGLWRERYSERVLSREITNLFEKRDRKPNELMANKEYAHTAVVCNKHKDFVNGQHALEPVFICSDPCEGIRCTVADAGRATSAAPTYFNAQRVTRYTQDGQEDISLIDGGLRCNNPSVDAWFHYDRDTKHSELGWFSSRLVSLGTGKYDGKNDGPPKRKLLQKWIHVPSIIQLMKDATTDPNSAEKQMRILSKSEEIDYYRFSATTGVCWIKMDDYENLDEIRSRTERYLKIPEVSKDIETCAMAIARDYVIRPQSYLANGEGLTCIS